MATFTKVYSFTEALAEKVHNLGSDQLKIALTNTAPTTALTNYAGITSPLATTNLSGATPFNVTTTSSAQTTGTYKLVLVDLTLTATGAVGPFQYIVLYNDTATNKEVIAYAAYTSSITMAAAETFLIDFDQAAGAITIG